MWLPNPSKVGETPDVALCQQGAVSDVLVCAIEARLSAVYYGDSDDGSASAALPAAEIGHRAAVDHRVQVHGGTLAEETRYHREELLRRYSS
jgi:hypothetical protein